MACICRSYTPLHSTVCVPYGAQETSPLCCCPAVAHSAGCQVRHGPRALALPRAPGQPRAREGRQGLLAHFLSRSPVALSRSNLLEAAGSFETLALSLMHFTTYALSTAEPVFSAWAAQALAVLIWAEAE